MSTRSCILHTKEICSGIVHGHLCGVVQQIKAGCCSVTTNRVKQILHSQTYFYTNKGTLRAEPPFVFSGEEENE